MVLSFKLLGSTCLICQIRKSYRSQNSKVYIVNQVFLVNQMRNVEERCTNTAELMKLDKNLKQRSTNTTEYTKWHYLKNQNVEIEQRIKESSWLYICIRAKSLGLLKVFSKVLGISIKNNTLIENIGKNVLSDIFSYHKLLNFK